MGGKFMQEILLDNVSYSKLNNLITHATAYTCEEDKVIDELGIWKREDIIEAIRSGKNIKGICHTQLFRHISWTAYMPCDNHRNRRRNIFN
jgi:hypothetical protein